MKQLDLTSTNIRFRTIYHMVATYEQTKKRLSNFYQKIKCMMMEFIQNH